MVYEDISNGILKETSLVYGNFGTILRRPLSEFWYHFPISISFRIKLFYFLPSIYRGVYAEQNALGLRRRSLMVFEISMYFEEIPIGILVQFPYLIFLSNHALLFFALYLNR